MKKLIFTAIGATALLNSCSHSGSSQLSAARHQEMKQLISSYDKVTNQRTNELNQQVKVQSKTISELTKKLLAFENSLSKTNEKVATLGTIKEMDSVEAVLALSRLHNSNISRSLYSILGEIKGKAAEAAILTMMEEENNPSNISSGLSALKSVNSKKIKLLCHRLLSEGEPAIMRYALENLKDDLTEKDIPLLLKVIENLPKNAKDYNLRYCWKALFVCCLNSGNKDSSTAILKVLKRLNKSSNSIAGWAALNVARYGTAEQTTEAIKALKPLLKGYSDSEYSYWFRDNAHINFVPVMKVLEGKVSGSYRRYLYEGYLSLDDASLAEHILKEYKSTKDSSTKSKFEKAFKEGFPGISWNSSAKTACLAEKP